MKWRFWPFWGVLGHPRYNSHPDPQIDPPDPHIPATIYTIRSIWIDMGGMGGTPWGVWGVGRGMGGPYPPYPNIRDLTVPVPSCVPAHFCPDFCPDGKKREKFCPKKCPIFVPTGRVIKYPKKCARGGARGGPPVSRGDPPVPPRPPGMGGGWDGVGRVYPAGILMRSRHEVVDRRGVPPDPRGC